MTRRTIETRMLLRPYNHTHKVRRLKSSASPKPCIYLLTTDILSEADFQLHVPANIDAKSLPKSFFIVHEFNRNSC